ncbi:MAG: sensor domain-containing diguanylate cyclase [Candidatus Hydrogenedentes bacterium]|nr:sensor domain-containing diguanylate cyclase [Candidatus Hydrogenedentota bacterium]
MESSLLDRVSDAPGATLSTFIPLHDYAVFCALMREAMAKILDGGSTPTVIVADSESAAQVNEYVGEASEWVSVLVVGLAEKAGGLLPSDRVFLCFSPHGTLSLVGSRADQNEDDCFSGGWSLKRRNADAIVSRLRQCGAVEQAAVRATQRIPKPSDDEVSSLALTLMSAHANAQAVQQETIARDKDDLFSVLSILKSISAKRRAHDILFVFVEQISNVVKSERCSIVRIWGGDPFGHVMASHEDATVTDKTIELFKYPELHQCMTTQKKIVINDARTTEGDEAFVGELKKAGINSLVVIPIVLFDQHVGSLLLRAARTEGNFSAREISFFEIVAEAASNALERAQLFESIQVANERLERLAITDGLTGLYNHRHFREHLQKEFDRASRYRLPLACLIFDVDDFKKLNDTFGHLVGDNVLKEISTRTLRCVRKSDLVARYGGEEFVVIMPQTGREGAEVEGERIRAIIADAPYSGVPHEHPVTISGGIGILDHDTMLNAEDLLRAADQALYEAKRNGKNRVVTAVGEGTS